MTELVTDADRYVDDVATHLEDLPGRERAELLEDLRAHVAEVLAEGGTLDDPADYAAELLRGRAPLAAEEPSLLRRIGRRWWIAAAVVVGLVGVTGVTSVSHTQPYPPAPPGPSTPTLPGANR
jgi:hypothetical protein